MIALRIIRHGAFLATLIFCNCAHPTPNSTRALGSRQIQETIFFHSERLFFQRVEVDGPADRIALSIGGAEDRTMLETRRLHDGSSVATVTGSCPENPGLTAIPAAHVTIEECDTDHGSVDLTNVDEMTGKTLSRRRAVGEGTYALGTSALLVDSDLTSAHVLHARTLRPLGPADAGRVEFHDGTLAIFRNGQGAAIYNERGTPRPLNGFSLLGSA